MDECGVNVSSLKMQSDGDINSIGSVAVAKKA